MSAGSFNTSEETAKNERSRDQGPSEGTQAVGHSGLNTMELCSENGDRRVGPGVWKTEGGVNEHTYEDFKNENTEMVIAVVSGDCVRQKSCYIKKEEELFVKEKVTETELSSAINNTESPDEVLINDRNVKESNSPWTLEVTHLSPLLDCGSAGEPSIKEEVGTELKPRVHEGDLKQTLKDLHTSKESPKSFRKTQHFQIPERSPTGKKSNQCAECGKTFTVAWSLKEHQRIHTGEKPFQCTECGKAFSRNSNLKAHQRTHTGVKPHLCSECGKTYSRATQLKIHQRIHLRRTLPQDSCSPPDSTNLIAHSGLDTLDLCSQNVARGAGPGVLKIEERVTKQIYGDLKEEDTSVDIDGVSDDCVKQQSVDIRNEEEQLIFKMMVTGMEFLSATKNEEHVDEDLITDLTVKESHLGRTLEGNRSSSPQVCGSPDEPVNEKKLGIELEEKVSEEQAVKDLHTSDRNLKIFSERQHLLSYKGKKSHPCTECGKVFTMTSSLKYHQRVHTANFKLRQGIQSGKKTFKCSECGAFFMSWSQLKIHQGIHTGLEDRRPSEHPQFLADKEITIGPPGGIEVMVPSGLDTLAQYSWNIDRGAGPGVLRNEEGATEQIYRNVKEEDTPVDIARISEVCVKRMEILSASRHEECADEDLITDLKVKEKDLEWTLEGSLSSSQQMCVSGPVNEKKVGIELQVKASEVQAGEDQHISVELLQMPSERRHLKIKQKPHQCTECGKAFTMASSLKYHQRVHMGEKPYKCTECGKTFTVASRLKYHQGVHKGENKHQCIECGKTFSRATNLKAHKRVHTGEKPFQCTECGKTFRWAKYLRIHHRRHTGEKPYRCKECGKTFIRKANFKLHQGIHTGKKTFQCAECGVFFMWPSQLKIHRRTHTGFEGRRTSKFPQVLADKEVTIDDPEETSQGTEGKSPSDLRLEAVSAQRAEGACFLKTEPGIPDKVYVQQKDTQTFHFGFSEIEVEQESISIKKETTPNIKEEDSSTITDSVALNSSSENAETTSTIQESNPRELGLRRPISFLKPNGCGYEHTDIKQLRHQPGDNELHSSGEMSTIFNNLHHHEIPHKTHKEEKPEQTSACGKNLKSPTVTEHHVNIHSSETSYQCDKCGKSFINHKVFKCHLKIHTGEKLLQCTKCGMTFLYNSDLERHQTVHTKEKPYQCSECGKSFRLPNIYTNHMKIHTGEMLPQCAECGRSFLSISDLRRHQTIHTGEKPHQCSECGKGFRNHSIYKNHMKIHTGEKLHRCTECGRGFLYNSDLRRHQIVHTGEKPHQCNQCGKSFTQGSTLKRHQALHSEERSYMCGECGESFRLALELTRHVKIHPGDKTSQSSRGEKSCVLRADLSHHQELHTEENPSQNTKLGNRVVPSSDFTCHQERHTVKKPYEGSGWGKSFGYQIVFKYHMKINTGKKPHQCTECGRSFRYNSDFIRHQRVHTGERPYQCSECGKRFTQGGALRRHQALHSMERPYACDECGKSFRLALELKRHMKMHPVEKPFRCNECGTGFLLSTDLTRHQKIHTQEKPHQCSECGKSFRHHNAYKNHMKIHNGEKPHQCTECEKSFRFISGLRRHQSAHTGKKNHTNVMNVEGASHGIHNLDDIRHFT